MSFVKKIRGFLTACLLIQQRHLVVLFRPIESVTGMTDPLRNATGRPV